MSASFAFSLLALGLALAYPVHAQTPAQIGAPREQAPLPPVSVTATRTERALDEVAATVTAHDHEAIEGRGARDLKDLLDDEVDLSVRAAQPRLSASSSTGRPGNEGLNIRGLEGNQVLLLVDGVRLPSAFSFGPFATGRLDFIDVDTLASAEVLRGPSSSQYGSDGLAGALALRTLRASDLLTDGKTLAGFVKLGTHSVDRSINATAALAMGGTPLQGLLLVSHRRGHETDNQGDNDSRFSDRTSPNPLDHDATSLLGSLSYQPNPQHSFEATLDARRRDQHIDVLTAVAEVPEPPSQTNPFGNQTVSLVTDDEVRRQRLSLSHRYANAHAPWLTEWRTQLYAQRAEVTQFHTEERAFSPDRTRDNRFEERSIGLSTLGVALLRGGLPQRLSFGLDLAQSNIEGERDGTVPPFGETFPSKPFPDTRYRTVGAFVQSEIDTESFTFIPALRFDKFSLVPTSSSGFGGETVSLGDQAVTPRLGAIWRLSLVFAPYAQWALGFRAPQPDQVNNGFSNPASGYTSIGNPDLKPEHARSIEIGARGQLDTLHWQVALFDNRYRDFISQQMVGGSFTPNDPAVFQYVNLTDARIRGGELRLRWKPSGPWSGEFAMARTQGQSDVGGEREPLDTVNPLRARFALRYDAGAWNVMAQWQHADGKAAKDVPSASRATQFLPRDADVVDLFASWRLNPTWSLRGALLNVFDETYWRWSDVRGLSDGPSTLAYSAPGRSVQLALRADF
ncbi:MAG TPA: TonB-dependent hemoglobin/transferrin/lactoferrin family receptor [Ideonella sp.]|uniref:TonB-dependent hemoglobin/transferrin/lactoferrin family receptor n=1 Tax=Ideonella sp. TaxID=1929293 RepID=UPI002E3633C0|nr:TonB-dependent hemoglobin/transferrin/lactoferrin family receptor [Ideonella sp.]HEX5686868.1 TonB-dependent hemoglobin/transferrin/lactoferrin family receptor [Ideonella sp.]